MHPLLLITLVAIPLYPSVYLYHRLSFVGAFRNTFASISSQYSPKDYFTLPIAQVEDLAYHAPSGLILAVGQGNATSRGGWWPAWANFDRPEDAAFADGGIWIIDPKTWGYHRLDIVGMETPFVTHGMDIWYDPSTPNIVYLHAVNHIPHLEGGVPQPHSDSRIEVFRIDLDTHPRIARHQRSLKHPLVRTPNDIYSLGQADLLVTNDHVNTRGHLRTAEDILTFSWTSRTTIVRMNEHGAEMLAGGLHNANGLGHGPNGTIILGDAAGGDLTTFRLEAGRLVKLDHLALGIQLDNPTYFTDHNAGSGGDASGYVLGGLLAGIHLDKTCRDPWAKVPSSVWIARRSSVTGKLEQKLLLEDDGGWVSGASIGMILPIEGKGGNKEAWLVVTGPFSLQVGVVKVNLNDVW